MNFYSTDKILLEKMSKYFRIPLTDSMKINYSVSYSQMRRLSIVTLELTNTHIIHSLIFFYTRSFGLYDVIYYRQKKMIRNIDSKFIKYIHRINKKILKNIPKINKHNYSKLKEVNEDSRKNEMKDIEIENLKNKLRHSKDTVSSLRNQIKTMKEKNRIERDSMKDNTC